MGRMRLEYGIDWIAPPPADEIRRSFARHPLVPETIPLALKDSASRVFPGLCDAFTLHLDRCSFANEISRLEISRLR